MGADAAMTETRRGREYYARPWRERIPGCTAWVHSVNCGAPADGWLGHYGRYCKRHRGYLWPSLGMSKWRATLAVRELAYKLKYYALPEEVTPRAPDMECPQCHGTGRIPQPTTHD
jgi:hypothetical protein